MVFVPWNSQFLQLIPESLEPPIEKHHLTEAKIEEVADRTCREDSQKSLVPGLAFTRFYILSACNHAMKLVARFSHAQYDGTSLIHLMKCLQASLKHETLPETAPFSSFIKHTRDNLSKSVNYWKKILQGSHLTRIVSCENIFKTREGRIIPIEVEKRVKLSRSYDRFTPATTFTTACAHFLNTDHRFIRRDFWASRVWPSHASGAITRYRGSLYEYHPRPRSQCQIFKGNTTIRPHTNNR